MGIYHQLECVLARHVQPINLHFLSPRIHIFSTLPPVILFEVRMASLDLTIYPLPRNVPYPFVEPLANTVLTFISSLFTRDEPLHLHTRWIYLEAWRLCIMEKGLTWLHLMYLICPQLCRSCPLHTWRGRRVDNQDRRLPGNR